MDDEQHQDPPDLSTEALIEQQQRQQREQELWHQQLQQQMQQQAVLAYMQQLAQSLDLQSKEAASWRARADAAEGKLHAIAPLLRASGATAEAMLERLAQARSLSDLADMSRMAFEVRTTMMSAEEHMKSASTATGAAGTVGSREFTHIDNGFATTHGKAPKKAGVRQGERSTAAFLPKLAKSTSGNGSKPATRGNPSGSMTNRRERSMLGNTASSHKEFAPELSPFPASFGGYQMPAAGWPAPFQQPIGAWMPPPGQTWLQHQVAQAAHQLQ